MAFTPIPAQAKKSQRKPLGPVVTVSATGNLVASEGQVSTATATCPAGKTMIGGGFSAPLAAGSAGHGLAVFETYRSGRQTWTVSAVATGDAPAAAVRSFGYCRTAHRLVTDQSAVGVMPGRLRSSASATATCPRHTSLISGGFQSNRDPGTTRVALPVTNLAGGKSSWTVTGVNNGTMFSRIVTAHAYCMARIRGPMRVSRSTRPTLTQFGTGMLPSPACPKKGRKPRRLLSAGGFSTPATVSPNPAVVLTESFSAGRSGWLLRFTNVTGPSSAVPVTSQAICL
jgi:hypothetical protein